MAAGGVAVTVCRAVCISRGLCPCPSEAAWRGPDRLVPQPGLAMTGPAAVVVRDHARLADGIQDVLVSRGWREMLERSAASGDPVQTGRAAWVTRETAAREEPGQAFSIRVVVPDPKPGIPAGPEARIMIGGMPVIAAAFDKGPAYSGSVSLLLDRFTPFIDDPELISMAGHLGPRKGFRPGFRN
jgi:hypothetical protein